MKTIKINPLTRISGMLEIDVHVEHNTVVDAKTQSLLFRGFEKMLAGRAPFDAIYFTQRICGICSTAHSVASSMALEDALSIVPTEQGRYLRDIIHGCEFLQNHIRHFYQYTLPDYVRLPGYSAIFDSNSADFRLPQPDNDRLAQHYFDSLEVSRSAHEMLAIFAGKAPHNHGVFIGGATMEASADKIIALKSILSRIILFLDSCMIPDVYCIANYYSSCFQLGKGWGNMLSYGCFNGYQELGTLYLDPTVYIDGKMMPFDANGITESLHYAWYRESDPGSLPEDDMNKENAYSWTKAPRYMGVPCEVGPLARLWLAGEYRNGISAMDRTIARVLEARKIAGILGLILSNLQADSPMQSEYSIPDEASGAGLIDTTRGALGHWLTISDKLISRYQIITPSVWNLSTKTDDGKYGPVEEALIGTTISDPENPMELGRIVRSFDPCVSCATHVYTQGKLVKSLTAIQ